ncbi:DUF5050 domain-containing protein [Pseudoflavitalea rhizosphaerae]|uniref:DUF5050 domain-containing protein n=1 Tax=Pseudoflavitalea rhizosphaerae TaxID=1884793 RepID=UPI000F8DB1C4|nr:DUF5050 domain-containing protein [Pseudoflavitalea rhizosphaerae]
MRAPMLLMAFTLFLSCSKNNKDGEGNGCAETPYIAPQAYSFPAWHPDGQIFVFNYVPISGIEISPCHGPMYRFKNDSAGFYSMNQDHTGLTKIMDRVFRNASWSPDGKKILYQEGSRIYMIPFDGVSFDTAARSMVVQDNAMSPFSFFNASSDSVYFRTSPVGASTQSTLYKVSLDGNGKAPIRTGEFYDISFGSDKRFYYLTANREIWSSDQNGQDMKKEVAVETNNNEQRRNPQYHDGHIYFISGSKLMRSGNTVPIVDNYVMDFAVSPGGEILYSQFQYQVSESNKQNGVFWIMNTDGSNKRQLTFNNF